MSVQDMDVSDTYLYCKEHNISSSMLLHKDLPTIPCLKNGLVLELSSIRKKNFGSWDDFKDWLQNLAGNFDPFSCSALQKSVADLQSKREKLQKNKRRYGEVEIKSFLECAYRLPEQKSYKPKETGATKLPRQSRFMKEAITTVNQSLALENEQLKAKILVGMNIVLAKDREIAALKKKIQDFNPHNIRRQIHRKNSKIAKHTVTIAQLKKDIKSTKTVKTKKLQDQVRYYIAKCQSLREQLKENIDINTDCTLENQIKQLQQDKIELLNVNAEYKDTIEELQTLNRKLIFYEDGKYTDSIRMCIMELLSYNVGILNVAPIIQSVLNMAGLEYDRLPNRTTINEMIIESRSLAQMQVAEALLQAPNATLHSDGTSKSGHKYLSYQISTTEGQLSIGLQEVVSGAAESTLQALQDIVQELSESVQQQASNTAEKIIANIKCTMSDRASAQKSFNSLLQEYRASILPTITANWDSLTPSEKQSMSNMHNFYCGMHLIVNMAEHTSETLKLMERNFSESPTFAFASENEPGTVRLIRTVCKAFEKRGDEKSGCPLQFTAYLKRKGLAGNPLIHFRGNRFNIIFANAARVYYLQSHIIDFLQNVWGTPNRLLKAVMEDASNNNYIAGCKALGIINKVITGPLWRILESNVHILQIPDYYTKLKAFLSECTVQNIHAVIKGDLTPFDASLINRDEVWESLKAPSQYDSSVQDILLSLFKTFELLLERVLADHQPVLLAAAENKEEVKFQTQTVKPTNTISERDFGKLDRLLREKPNASTLALEAHILFTNNKTSKWLEAKSSEEKQTLFAEARRNAPKHRKKYRQHISELEEERRKIQVQKQKEKEESARKIIESKEKITSELTSYGLWVSSIEVDSNLSVLKSETQKKKALKAQLRFRKKVLQQQHPDDSIFNFSSKEKGQFDSELLRANLLKLVEEAKSSEGAATCSTVIPLTNKDIEHNFKETDGTINAYKGKVISQVPGFPEWYNVVYIEEPDVVYTFKLTEDLDNGDLKIL